jgi:hypothetical protein
LDPYPPSSNRAEYIAIQPPNGGRSVNFLKFVEDKTTCKFTISWSSRVKYDGKNSKYIPNKPGVYEIQGFHPESNTYTRKYVGQGKDLRQRFLEHLSENEQNVGLKDFLKSGRAFLRYSTWEDESARLDIEKGLYDQFRHSLNDGKYRPAGSGRHGEIEVIEA